MDTNNSKGLAGLTSKKPMEDFIQKQKSETQLEQQYNATVVRDPYVLNPPLFTLSNEELDESSHSMIKANQVEVKKFRPTLDMAKAKS